MTDSSNPSQGGSGRRRGLNRVGIGISCGRGAGGALWLMLARDAPVFFLSSRPIAPFPTPKAGLCISHGIHAVGYGPSESKMPNPI